MRILVSSARHRPAGDHPTTLSATDFATVDGIMRSMVFRQSEMTGVMRDPSPGGQVISSTSLGAPARKART
jgi:hypothetical protein